MSWFYSEVFMSTFNLFSQMFRGNLAQFLLFANESTYPAEILELSHLRVVTEHTLEVHWVFQGTAQVSRIDPINLFAQRRDLNSLRS